MAAAAASSTQVGVMAAVGQHAQQTHDQSSAAPPQPCRARGLRSIGRSPGELLTLACLMVALPCLPLPLSSLPLRRSPLLLLLSSGGASIHAKDDEFPILCETCLGPNPLVRMVRRNETRGGGESEACDRMR